MARYGYLLWALTIMIAANVSVAKDCYVVLRSGDKVKGINLAADRAGNLKLQMARNGPTQTFKKGSYAYAMVPKPREVTALERAKPQVVIKQAGAIFEQYKYLGWGDHISYLEGMAHIDTKNYAEAKKAFERGQRYRARHGDQLVKGMALALLGLKQLDRVQPMLEQMLKSSDEKTAAFAFNVRGRILADQGKKKEAVLEFLKVLLLFKPGSVGRERKEAKGQVVALLK